MEKSTIEQELRVHGGALIHPTGNSMEPLLHSRTSTVMIETVTAPLRRYDVVLYLRPAGEKSVSSEEHYILHRIIRVKEKEYLVRGDNCLYQETVSGENIIGRMTGYFKDEQFVDCAHDPEYLRYLKSLKSHYFYRLCREALRKIACKFRKSVV